MKIIQNKENPLLRRREVKLIIEAEKNPTMQEAAKTVAEQFKTAEENLAVKLVKGKFGRNTFLITANIYNSKEDKDNVEPKAKAKKGKEEKAEEKKEVGGEKKEEKPEEKKEEKKETKEAEKEKNEEKPAEKPEEEKEEQVGEKKEEK